MDASTVASISTDAGELLAAVHDTMADRGNLVRVVQRMIFAAHQGLQNQPHALFVIGDGLLDSVIALP